MTVLRLAMFCGLVSLVILTGCAPVTMHVFLGQGQRKIPNSLVEFTNERPISLLIELESPPPPLAEIVIVTGARLADQQLAGDLFDYYLDRREDVVFLYNAYGKHQFTAGHVGIYFSSEATGSVTPLVDDQPFEQYFASGCLDHSIDLSILFFRNGDVDLTVFAWDLEADSYVDRSTSGKWTESKLGVQIVAAGVTVDFDDEGQPPFSGMGRRRLHWRQSTEASSLDGCSFAGVTFQ